MSAVFAPLMHTDPAVFGRVAVLHGGDSSERDVSLASGAAVLQALQARGVDAHGVDGIPSLLAAQQGAQSFTRVFNILHGGDGENGVLQGLLAALGLPCTGSGVLGCALSLDKIRTKQVWIAEGLPTPRFVRLAADAAGIEQALQAAIAQLGLPAFLKPSSEGSSVGVARILEAADVPEAVRIAREYGGEMLLEQMVRGDEYSVPVIGGHALPSIRIVPKGQWYDYSAKYLSGDTQYICPGADAAGEAEIGRLAVAAFRAAGCSGWGRVDVMRDAERGWQLIEVNTAPGMTATSLVPKSAQVLGVGFEELCWRILEQTL